MTDPVSEYKRKFFNSVLASGVVIHLVGLLAVAARPDSKAGDFGPSMTFLGAAYILQSIIWRFTA